MPPKRHQVLALGIGCGDRSATTNTCNAGRALPLHSHAKRRGCENRLTQAGRAKEETSARPWKAKRLPMPSSAREAALAQLRGRGFVATHAEPSVNDSQDTRERMLPK
jgi:hypothetical protein